ncbi:hypothetical protein BHE74_00016642 [Ensete ventricosum]|nr:hypothetical protein BHE74_00016642 [Ensete ventricosum]
MLPAGVEEESQANATMHPLRQPPLLHCFRATLSSRHPLCLLFLAPRPSQSSPRASISGPWSRLKPLGRTRTYFVATKVAEEPAAEWSGGGGDGDGNGNGNGSYFFAGEGVSWKSLGISVHLSNALAKASLPRPSLVQVPPVPCFLYQ